MGKLIKAIEALVNKLPDQPKKCCYNCQKGFRNNSFMQDCHLANWSEHPIERDRELDWWIRDNQREDGTIWPGSLGCPRFETSLQMYPPPDKIFQVWDRE